MSTNQTLIICGPTATGKTSLGIKLAQKFNGEIISADSRQVYKGMNIGTGKGLLNPGSQYQVVSINGMTTGYFLDGSVKIWGYDLVEPNQPFSVAEYRELMVPTIEDIWKRKKLPIIVGGTGFYIEALVNPPKTIGIKSDQNLRQELEQLSVSQLQNKLRTLDKIRLERMNQSDRNNPRRLIRAIEILTTESSTPGLLTPGLKCHKLYVGLTASKKVLKERVIKSVENRAAEVFTQEIIQLETDNFDWSSPAASATGYKEWKAYLDSRMSLEEAKEEWVTREHQYQKRQLTWFRKKDKIHWFDILDSELETSVEALVQAWYS